MGFFKTQQELDMEKSQDKIRPFENVLQTAIRAAAYSNPMGLTGTLPASEALKTGFQTAQGLIGDLPQNIVSNPMTFARSGIPGVQLLSGQIAGQDLNNLLASFSGRPESKTIKPEKGIAGSIGRGLARSFLEPRSTQGKLASAIGSMASGFVPLAAPAKFGEIAEAPNKIIAPFRTSPIKESITSIDKSIDFLKSKISQTGRVGNILKSRAASSAEKLGYKGGREIKGIVDEAFDVSREAYKGILDAPASNVTVEDMASVLDKTLVKKGVEARNFNRPAESALENMKNRLVSMTEKETPDIKDVDPITNKEFVVKKGTPKKSPKMADVIELKNLKNEIFNILKYEPDLEGEFFNHLGKLLESKGLSDVVKVNDMYRKAHKLAENAELFKEAKIKSVALGKESAEEVSDLSKAESRFGTGYINKARELSNKSSYQDYRLGKKKMSLRNQLLSAEKNKGKLGQELLTRQKRKGYAAGGVIGAGAIKGIDFLLGLLNDRE